MTTTHFTAIAGAAPSLAPALSSPVVPGASKRAFWIQPTACYFQSDHALIDRAARHIGVYGNELFEPCTGVATKAKSGSIQLTQTKLLERWVKVTQGVPPAALIAASKGAFSCLHVAGAKYSSFKPFKLPRLVCIKPIPACT